MIHLRQNNVPDNYLFTGAMKKKFEMSNIVSYNKFISASEEIILKKYLWT